MYIIIIMMCSTIFWNFVFMDYSRIGRLARRHSCSELFPQDCKIATMSGPADLVLSFNYGVETLAMILRDND